MGEHRLQLNRDNLSSHSLGFARKQRTKAAMIAPPHFVGPSSRSRINLKYSRVLDRKPQRYFAPNPDRTELAAIYAPDRFLRSRDNETNQFHPYCVLPDTARDSVSRRPLRPPRGTQGFTAAHSSQSSTNAVERLIGRKIRSSKLSGRRPTPQSDST